MVPAASAGTLAEITVKEGETETYTGREVRLRSGNGAATVVSYNGQPAVALGQQGEVVERVYTAQ